MFLRFWARVAIGRVFPMTAVGECPALWFNAMVAVPGAGQGPGHSWAPRIVLELFSVSVPRVLPSCPLPSPFSYF